MKELKDTRNKNNKATIAKWVKTKETTNNYLINPTNEGITSILAVVVFGRTFN